MLDLGESRVVARSDPCRGVRAQGALRRRDLPGRAHERPAHRLRRQHGRDHAGARRPASSGSRPTSTSPPTCAARPGVPRARAPRRGAGCGRLARLRRCSPARSGCACGASSTGCRTSTTSTRPRTSSRPRSASSSPAPTTRTTSSTRRRSRTCCTRVGWFGGGWLRRRRRRAAARYATDPTAVFVVARVDVGGAGHGGRRVRLPDRRAPVRPPGRAASRRS